MNDMDLTCSKDEIVEVDKQQPVKLENLTINQILEKCENEEYMALDQVPYENVRNNSKIFLIYYAKSQLRRVIKLSNNLEILEQKLMETVESIQDPQVILNTITSIQSMLTQTINLIDKISTNDNYVKFVFNDNRTVLNQIESATIDATNNIDLSRESRVKLRKIALDLMDKINVVDSETNVDVLNASDLVDVDNLGGDSDV